MRTDRRLGSERGVAMVEFALVLPLLLLLVVGILSFGRLLFYWISANHLANEGARWAAVDCNPTADCAGGASPSSGVTIQQYIYNNATTAEQQRGLTVCLTLNGKTPSTLSIQDPITITVKESLGFPAILGISSLAVTGSATVSAENFRGGTLAAPRPSFTEGGWPAGASCT